MKICFKVYKIAFKIFEFVQPLILAYLSLCSETKTSLLKEQIESSQDKQWHYKSDKSDKVAVEHSEENNKPDKSTGGHFR